MTSSRLLCATSALRRGKGQCWCFWRESLRLLECMTGYSRERCRMCCGSCGEEGRQLQQRREVRMEGREEPGSSGGDSTNDVIFLFSSL